MGFPAFRSVGGGWFVLFQSLIGIYGFSGASQLVKKVEVWAVSIPNRDLWVFRLSLGIPLGKFFAVSIPNRDLWVFRLDAVSHIQTKFREAQVSIPNRDLWVFRRETKITFLGILGFQSLIGIYGFSGFPGNLHLYQIFGVSIPNRDLWVFRRQQ